MTTLSWWRSFLREVLPALNGVGVAGAKLLLEPIEGKASGLWMPSCFWLWSLRLAQR